MTDLSGVALIIAAVLGPASGVTIALMNNRNVRKVGATVDEINHAVNGKGPRESSISEDVTTILNKQELDVPSEPPALVPRVGRVEHLLEELLAEVRSR